MKVEEIIEIINDNDIEIAASIEPLEEGIFIGTPGTASSTSPRPV